ncbi:MAG: LytTR family transcriptional regulator [Ruminococcaceae bacterium]|nr:LytTR family transcriptional regulator [Oscillospiraceae bacterium]
MKEILSRFLHKNHVDAQNIKYIIREEGLTKIYLADNRIIETYHTIKSLRELLSEDEFLNVGKGLLLSASYIADIDHGIYTMTDGRSFHGRKRNFSEHAHNKAMLVSKRETQAVSDFPTEYAILDKMPIPFAILEVTELSDRNFPEFYFRYCNNEFLNYHNCSMEDILNKSHLEFFGFAMTHLLAAFADIAFNGGSRIIHNYREDNHRDCTMHCFQLRENYCAVAVVSWEYK